MSILHCYSIDHLVDVRSVPYSKYADQFNRIVLKQRMEDIGINYTFAGDELGGRVEAENSDELQEFTNSSSFKHALSKICRLARKSTRVAVMCSENDPLDCHRFALIARALHGAGYEVQHIMADDSIKNHRELEREMLRKYSAQVLQVSLFTADESDDPLDEAYRRKAVEIGLIDCD